MFRDLSEAPSIQEFSVDEFSILPGANQDVFAVGVATNEIVQVIFDYTIHDRRNRCARVGSFQVMANGREAIPDPAPCSHVTTEAYGEEPQNLQMDIRSSGSQLLFRATNAYTQQEPIYVSAKVKVVHVPEWPSPKIRLTLSGLSGGATVFGLGNGVHTLIPFFSYRSPYGGSASSYIPYSTGGGGTTLSFSTGTQCERWNKNPYGVSLATYQAMMDFNAQGGTGTVSTGVVKWHNGVTTYSTALTFTTGRDGFCQDRLLSGSLVVGPVTIAWEREPTDPPTRWGNY